MTNVRKRARVRRSFARNLATAIAVLAPMLLLPFLLQGNASAKGARILGSATSISGSGSASAVACQHGQLDVSDLTVDSDANVSVTLTSTDCDVQTVSLVAYQTQGPDYNSAGTQTLFDKDTAYVTSKGSTLRVRVPNCFFQIDLIYGSDTPTTLAGLTYYFTTQGTLIQSYNAGTQGCLTTPPTSTPPGTSTPPASSPPVVPSTSVPSSSSSGSVAPSSSGTSAPPSSSASVSPTETVTTPSSPTTSSSSAVVSPVQTSKSSENGGTATVSGITFTNSPTASALPSTGFPIAGLLLIGAELIAGGLALFALFGRRSNGRHRLLSR